MGQGVEAKIEKPRRECSEPPPHYCKLRHTSLKPRSLPFKPHLPLPSFAHVHSNLACLLSYPSTTSTTSPRSAFFIHYNSSPPPLSRSHKHSIFFYLLLRETNLDIKECIIGKLSIMTRLSCLSYFCRFQNARVF